MNSVIQWIFTRWYFWVLGALYSFWVGYDEFISRFYKEFFFTSLASFSILFVVFLIISTIIYLDKRSKEKDHSMNNLAEAITGLRKK